MRECLLLQGAGAGVQCKVVLQDAFMPCALWRLGAGAGVAAGRVCHKIQDTRAFCYLASMPAQDGATHSIFLESSY